MKNFLITLLLFTLGIEKSHAQKIKPVASFSIGYVNTISTNEINSGLFEIDQSKIRVGFSLTNNFNLKNNCFIKTGLRYTGYKTDVTGLNLFEYVLSKPDPFIWTQKFESYILPINFGKHILLFNKILGEVFIGISSGILTYGTSITRNKSVTFKNINTKDTLERFIEFPTIKKPTIFFSVLDVGFNFQPYPHNSRINLGFLFSAQLNQTFESNYIGKITNISKNETVNYDLRINHKYI